MVIMYRCSINNSCRRRYRHSLLLSAHDHHLAKFQTGHCLTEAERKAEFVVALGVAVRFLLSL